MSTSMQAVAEPDGADEGGPPTSRKHKWLDLGMILTAGFIEDQFGHRRKMNWGIVFFLGLLLPAGTIFGQYCLFSGTSLLHWNVLFIWHIPFVWSVVLSFLLAFVLFRLNALAISAYLHRSLTHRAVVYDSWLQHVLAILAGLGWEGSPLWWARDHRRHHARADIPGEDPHSPWEYSDWRGLVWPQGVWLFFKRAFDGRIPRDLDENKVVKFHHRAYPLWTILSLVLPFALLGQNGLFIAGFLRIAALMTVTGFVNSWCHWWGTRAVDKNGDEYLSDDSRNSLAVAAMAAGEGWHGNHHADPTSAEFNPTIEFTDEAVAAGATNPRFLLDFTWKFIKFAERHGWAHKVRSSDPERVFTHSQRMPTPQLRCAHCRGRSRHAKLACRRDRALLALAIARENAARRAADWEDSAETG